MKVSMILEIGNCGFGFKQKVFDCAPTKWSTRLAVGVIAITVVWGDAAAIRGFGA